MTILTTDRVREIRDQHDLRAAEYDACDAPLAQQYHADIAALCDSELARREQQPAAVMFQHDETGRTTSVFPEEADDFARNNPRWANCGPLYTTPPADPRIARVEALIQTWRSCAAISAIGPLHAAGVTDGYSWAADELEAALKDGEREGGS